MKTIFSRHSAAVRLVAFLLTVFCAPAALAGSIPEPDLILYGQIKVASNQRLTAGTLTWQFRSATRTILVSTLITNINDQFSYLLRVPCETEVGSFLASSNVIRLISVPTSYDRSQVTILTDTTGSATFLNLSQTNLSMASTDRGRIERIDLLASGLAGTDIDGNGLPDFWEKQYFGRIGIDPNDDPDQDGLTNLQEYKAGTNPMDVNSRFAFIVLTSQQPAGVRLEWSSVEGTFYVLQRSGLLSDPSPTPWTTVQTHIPASGNDVKTSVLDATATGTGPYFYRLQVEP